VIFNGETRETEPAAPTIHESLPAYSEFAQMLSASVAHWCPIVRQRSLDPAPKRCRSHTSATRRHVVLGTTHRGRVPSSTSRRPSHGNASIRALSSRSRRKSH